MRVGSVERDAEGRLYNMVALLDDGRVVAARRKHELPNYGTFDEKRVFAAGPLPEPVEWRGVRLGLPICEDGWYPHVCAHLAAEIGRASCRERVCPYVLISVVAGSLKQKTQKSRNTT